MSIVVESRSDVECGSLLYLGSVIWTRIEAVYRCEQSRPFFFKPETKKTKNHKKGQKREVAGVLCSTKYGGLRLKDLANNAPTNTRLVLSWSQVGNETRAETSEFLDWSAIAMRWLLHDPILANEDYRHSFDHIVSASLASLLLPCRLIPSSATTMPRFNISL